MEKWYEYLYYTENVAVNIERVEKVEDITGRETLQYVMRTLSILDKIILRDGITDSTNIVRKVLQWSEVAKGGTAKDRAEWLEAGLPLDIHNIASAEIYRGFYPDDNVGYILIKTHGMIGQCLRGEVPVSCNNEVLELLPVLGEKRLKDILYILNECIIAAVSEELWDKVGDATKNLIDQIISRTSKEMESPARVCKLLPKLGDPSNALIKIFEEKYFPKYELWYFEAALYFR